MVVVAAGLVVLLDPFGGDEPVTGTTTTTSVPEPEDTTTSSMERPTSSTAPAQTGWEDGRYRVVGVASDDVLNVRENPGVGHPVVGTLPPDGAVQLDGYSAQVGDAEWRSVLLEDGTRGWVNASYLAPPSGWEVPFDGPACREDGPAYGGTQTIEGTDPDAFAHNALDIFTFRSEDCDRIVIVLGVGEGLSADGWSSIPAPTVPSGTSVTSGGSIVEIRIPGIRDVRPLAQTVEGHSGYLLATRDMPKAQERADLVFRAFFDSNRRAALQLLDNPARVVVDVRTAPTGSGLDVAYKRGGLTVVKPIQTDLAGPGVGLPVEVTGWARPFEAAGIAILRRPALEPGTGEQVEATFSGTDHLGTQVASVYPYTTADYIEAWGAFSFTIDDLAPGTYELFVGDFDMESGDPFGIYQTFTVAG